MVTGLLIWILVFEMIIAVALLALVACVYQFMKQEAGWQGERHNPDEYVHPANLDELSHPFWQGSNKLEEAQEAAKRAAQIAHDEWAFRVKHGDIDAPLPFLGLGLGLTPAGMKPFDEEEFLHRHEKIKKDIAKIELPGEVL